MVIDPAEKRDQHCKIYVERSMKKVIDKYATLHGYSFSEAGRMLLNDALEFKGI